MGKVPLDKMPDFFRESSIFCFPTEVEPLGIALYEAALYGLGLCSTRYEAAEEFLQHEQSVLFNELGDEEALYRNLMRLIENPELCRAYGSKAQSIAKARFNWTRVGDEIRKAILNRLGSGEIQQSSCTKRQLFSTSPPFTPAVRARGSRAPCI